MKPELRACRTAARPCGREAVAQGGPQVWPGPGREHLGVRQGAPQVAPTKKINCLALPVRAPKAFIPTDTGHLQLAPWRAGTVGTVYRGGNGDRGMKWLFMFTPHEMAWSGVIWISPAPASCPLHRHRRRRLSPGPPLLCIPSAGRQQGGGSLGAR